MQAKIRELYKASQESQAAAAMMGGGGQPINPYPGTHYQYNSIIDRNTTAILTLRFQIPH